MENRMKELNREEMEKACGGYRTVLSDAEMIRRHEDLVKKLTTKPRPPRTREQRMA